MAGGPRLTPRLAAVPLAVLGAVVLAVHLLGLEWLTRVQATPSALRAVADPMFTRVLAPEAPPPPPAGGADAETAPAQPPPREGALRVANAVPSVPRTTTPTTPAPAPAQETAPEPALDVAASAQAAPETPAAETASASAPTAPPAASLDAVVTAPAAAPAAPGTSAAPPFPADPWPRDTRVTYQLRGDFRGNPLHGNARVQWQRQGPAYQVQVLIDFGLVGSLTLTSQGEATAQGLVPRAYEEVRRSRRRSVRMTDAEVVLQDGRSLPRPASVQDAASQFVELGQRFASGRQALALGSTVEVWLARPGGLDAWTYDVVAQDLLRTPRLGEVAAWRLRPRPLATPRGNITAEFWFAPSLQYLPARVRLSMGDEATIDLIVEVIEQR